MNECEKAKKQLVEWETSDMLLKLILQGSDGFPHDAEGIYQQSVLHIQNCSSCRKWLDGCISGEFKSEWEKSSRNSEKYCCSIMYDAVENNRKDKLNVALIDFQGDPVWAVMNLEVIGGNLMIGYCPWCGNKLPDKPFISEKIDKPNP